MLSKLTAILGSIVKVAKTMDDALLVDQGLAIKVKLVTANSVEKIA
jgi:hypothetical protein